MNIEFYRPLWGRDRSFRKMAEEAKESGFSGLEGHLPDDESDLLELKQVLQHLELKYIGEICTGGSNPEAYWVPNRGATVDEHIASFESELQRFDASGIEIEFINCMGGLDAWSVDESVRFFEQCILLSQRYGYLTSFETHRTRSLYAPWATQRILNALPELTITADLSHWCVVAERLIDEAPALDAVIPLTHHIHGRVGYDQGAQVPNPAAPEYQRFLSAHQNWWQRIWQSQAQRGYEVTTMCTEYGPDGYLHLQPFTQEPVANLWEIMQWAAKTETAHFNSTFKKA